MTAGQLLALIISIAAVVSAFYAVVSRRLMRAALSFALTTILAGLLYMVLGQILLGLVQVFLYAGGVAVLVAFAYITSISTVEVEEDTSPLQPYAVAAAFLTSFVIMLAGFYLLAQGKPSVSAFTLEQLAEVFLENRVFDFEIISVLLLAAFVAALAFLRWGRQK